MPRDGRAVGNTDGETGSASKGLIISNIDTFVGRIHSDCVTWKRGNLATRSTDSGEIRNQKFTDARMILIE